MSLTVRDRAVLGWLVRWRHATASQMYRWLSLPEQARLHENGSVLAKPKWYERLKKLRERDVVDHRRPTAAEGLYRVSRQGLDMAGLEGWSVPRWRQSQRRHDLRVVDAALHYAAQDELAEVLSERQMKRVEDLGGGSWSTQVRWETADGRRRESSHRPDLWLLPEEDREGPRLAVEVELSRKGRRRLEAILRSLRQHPGCVQVIYLTTDEEIARGVRRAAGPAGLVDRGEADAGQTALVLHQVESWS